MEHVTTKKEIFVKKWKKKNKKMHNEKWALYWDKISRNLRKRSKNKKKKTSNKPGMDRYAGNK